MQNSNSNAGTSSDSNTKVEDTSISQTTAKPNVGRSLSKGMKVHYTAPYGTTENGIIKDLNDSQTIAWVVYKCDDEWSNYQNYTGCATNIQDLSIGWVS